jgi:hypothetical protein
MMITRRGMLWAMGAVVGIVVAVALTWSVSRLAGQRIGLSSASPSVAGGLVPRERASPGAARHSRAPAGTTTPAAPPARGQQPTASDDGGDASGGGGAQPDD